MTIRVLIADDQELVRKGFRMILGAEPDIDVVGEAANGSAAVAEANELVPDVVVMSRPPPVVAKFTVPPVLRSRAPRFR